VRVQGCVQNPREEAHADTGGLGVQAMTVYAALYNPMYHESAAYTLSLHLTKLGAYRAMQKHKWEVWEKEMADNRATERRWRTKLDTHFNPFSFMWWGIKQCEVLE
jgi:hypothetical protein